VPALVLGLSACGGNAGSSNSTGSTAEHLYVTTATGQILQFTLPLTSTSTPSVTVPSTGGLSPFEVAVDSNGNLAVTDLLGNLAIYHPPLTSSSTPAAVFPNGAFISAGPIAFDSNGNLFAAGKNTGTGGGGLNIFAPPFSSASTPSQVLSVAFSGSVDSNGNLYSGFGGGVGPCGIAVLAPPYTGAGSVFARQTCIDGGFGKTLVADNLLFATFTTSCSAVIEAFPLPGSTATVGGVSGGCDFGTFTADSNGNLYITSRTFNTISVFVPPFFSSSVPSMSLSNLFMINGMAAGK